jgi:tetratricopeptide (TPR) repeat protein
MKAYVCSLVLACALASSAAVAQFDDFSKKYGTIQGHVMPAQGETDIPRLVTVRLIGQGFQKVTYATAGRFYFSEVPAGNYLLVLSSEGRHETAVSLAGWSPQSGDPLVSLVLGNRVATREGPVGNPVVDVKELQIPKKAHREFQKGVEALQKDELPKAEKHLLKALDIYPDYYQAYNNLGVISMKLDRAEEAEENFEKAIEISPENLIAQKNLGYLRLSNGEAEEAITPLAAAVRLDSEDAVAHAYLAEAYLLSDELDRAIEHFERALILDSQLAYPNYRLGHVALHEKQYDRALKYFRQFLSLSPEQGREEVEPIVAGLEKYFREVLARTSFPTED